VQQTPEPPHHHDPPDKGGATRRFLNRGVQVEIREAPGRVALTLDGVPIEVSVDRGEYFAHVAHMFTGFGSIDALVDHLLANEGRTWTLHGHVCDERCRGGGHHHGHGSGHGHGHDHSHHHGHGGGAPGQAEEGAAARDASAGKRRTGAAGQPARRPSRKPRRGGAR
jgi:hypothetical protein